MYHKKFYHLKLSKDCEMCCFLDWGRRIMVGKRRSDQTNSGFKPDQPDSKWNPESSIPDCPWSSRQLSRGFTGRDRTTGKSFEVRIFALCRGKSSKPLNHVVVDDEGAYLLF